MRDWRSRAFPVPGLLMLMGFRMGRTSMRLELDEQKPGLHLLCGKGLVRI